MKKIKRNESLYPLANGICSVLRILLLTAFALSVPACFGFFGLLRSRAGDGVGAFFCWIVCIGLLSALVLAFVLRPELRTLRYWGHTLHRYEGCTCRVCGKHRDEGHDWDGCTCRICREHRDKDHDWDGCTCRVCGKHRDEGHDWKRTWLEWFDPETGWRSGCGLECTRCGAQKPDDE